MLSLKLKLVEDAEENNLFLNHGQEKARSLAMLNQ
jgi:hypothetical protein